MIRILVTGTRPRIGKTALICNLLKVFSGFAVVQFKEEGFFTSIISEPEGEEANLLRSTGSMQVIHILSDPKDVADAMDQAQCFFSLQIEGIIIEGNLSSNNFPADIIIYLTDRPLSNLDPILEVVNMIVVKPKSKGDIEWKDSLSIPVFVLDMQDMDKDEWKRFITNLKELIDSLKT